MKKSTLTILATLCAGATFATEYHWRGAAPDMTDAGKSGAWNDSSNWTDKDGNAAGGYPSQTGDTAVFHGTAIGGYVEIKDADTINIDEIRFEEGDTLLLCSHKATVTAGKMTFGSNATLDFAPTNPTAHWENEIFSIPNFTVGNRSELVIDSANGQIRNAVSHWYPPTSGEVGYDTRGALTIDADGKLTPLKINPSSHLHDTGIGGETTWPDALGCLYGCCGNYRGFLFGNAEAKFIVPSGFFIGVSPYAYMGRIDTAQGTVSTENAPMCLWGPSSYSAVGDASVRAKLDAPELTLAAHSHVTIYDDHSTDSVAVYRLVAGTFSLGGTFSVSGDGNTTATQTCTMNAATFNIGWDATLDVACANALNADSTINVSSYNKKGSVFGKINLANNGVVNKLQIDGADLDAGTYGATGSGATNIRDDIFTGSGVLTVTNGTYVPPDDPPVTEKEPMIIYFN